MKKVILRIIRLFTGLFLYSVGIVLTINASLGLAPWDVFHQGLSKVLHITMGQASIGAGIVLVILNSILGERLGWGTLSNMLFIGLFIDVLMINNLIPVFQAVIPRFIMMVIGMLVIGMASYLYLGAQLGSGPRDGLMVALTKKTRRSIRLIRSSIEICVLILGYLFGGFIGLGTLLIAFSIGYFVQLVFKVFRFDVSKIKHRFIDEDIKLMIDVLTKKKKKVGETNLS